jgi:hypothetical protein
MGIGIDRLAERSRVSLPSVGSKTFGEWIDSYARGIATGPRNGGRDRYVILDQMVVETKEIVVHRFTVGDTEDPDLYAAQPLWDWRNSDKGQWVMERAIETPFWSRHIDPYQYNHQYAIQARFDTKTLTEYYLRFGKTDS